MTNFLYSNRKWTWPLFGLLIFAPFSSWLDFNITKAIYDRGNDPVEHFMSLPLLDYVYEFGPILTHITALFSAFIFIASYVIPKLKKWRNPCLILILTYAIGAGLLINGIFKEYWGRPRPKQVEAFGGTQAFRPFYLPNFHQKIPSKSFPCGHCAMGFYFFALALVGIRLQNKRVTALGYILALSLGLIIGIVRMAQGGHFLSDILVSAIIMWYTALAMDWLAYSGEEYP